MGFWLSDNWRRKALCRQVKAKRYCCCQHTTYHTGKWTLAQHNYEERNMVHKRDCSQFKKKNFKVWNLLWPTFCTEPSKKSRKWSKLQFIYSSLQNLVIYCLKPSQPVQLPQGNIPVSIQDKQGVYVLPGFAIVLSNVWCCVCMRVHVRAYSCTCAWVPKCACVHLHWSTQLSMFNVEKRYRNKTIWYQIDGLLTSNL